MDKAQIQKALADIKAQPPRKFTQSYDLVINLKNLELKSNPVDLFVTLPFPKGKSVKIAAFVDRELVEQATKFCDLAIRESEFIKYNEKKKAKKLGEQYNFFIAQASLMPKIAANFGKVLGIRGKMPNPKLGCVIPPNANVEALVKKLKHTVRLQAKKGLNLQCIVGKEDQPEEQIIDNILTAYNAVVKHLPNELQNIKNVTLKLSMGKPVKV
ncbi:MAG TPA: 50S ribosomal protein L1 [Candidatus Nanoarchaeia archaeon]|nr:50S ribosomal protein L1 [Candidatus Nanoarchaeia archaeon]